MKEISVQTDGCYLAEYSTGKTFGSCEKERGQGEGEGDGEED